jgi:predicted nucleic-acid-binding protein
LIALDTDTVLRLLLGDDPAQSAAAERLWLRARKDQTPLFISDVVLVDIAWALESRLKLGRAEIADILDQIFATELVVVTSAATLDHALAAYRTGRAAFADYLIREHARLAGANEVVTFDRAMAGEPGFRVLLPSP